MQGRIQLEISGRARAEAHIEHFAHVRDAGSVETQRLVECRRMLPSGKVTHKKDEMQQVSKKIMGQCAGTSSVQERSQLEIGGRARAEAHIEHFAHVRDARSVETQRLVERIRSLPSGKGIYKEGEMPRVYWEVVGQCTGAGSVQGRSQLESGGRARAEAHIEHGAHVRDAGGVETQRLVERRRPLPSGKGTHKKGEMPRVPEEAMCGNKQRAAKEPTGDWGQGTRGSAHRIWSPCS